jgi:D-cysteine desulfhydrase
MSAGAAAGNKIRKLEFLLAEAQRTGAEQVITCGGEQSNHARATAICAAALGMRAILYLRSAEPNGPRTFVGNLLLDRLAGAEIRYISQSEYGEVDRLMREAKLASERAGKKAAVIVEGGSDGLGAFGYIHAMVELKEQLTRGEARGLSAFDAIVHACGSGGTAAGVALGSALTGVAPEVIAVPVCDDAEYFRRRVARICEEARRLCAELVPPNPIAFPEGFQGPAYGEASDDQWRFLSDVARASGLMLDPVYGGKALYGLAKLSEKPARALFIHTGGLPGLLAQSEQARAALFGA